MRIGHKFIGLISLGLTGCNQATVNAVQSGVPVWQIILIVFGIALIVASWEKLYLLWRQSAPEQFRRFQETAVKLIGLGILLYAGHQVVTAYRVGQRVSEGWAAYCALVAQSIPPYVSVGLSRGDMTPEMYIAIRRAMEEARQSFPSRGSYLDCEDFERRGTEQTRIRQRELYRAYERERLGIRY